MAGNNKSKFPRTRAVPDQDFENRFQRFYHLHRVAINKHRRDLYAQRKADGQCVKCGEPACEDSVFCTVHISKSRKDVRSQVTGRASGS